MFGRAKGKYRYHVLLTVSNTLLDEYIIKADDVWQAHERALKLARRQHPGKAIVIRNTENLGVNRG